MHLTVFDIDGTLTRTDEIDGECYIQAVLEVLGIGPIRTLAAALAGSPHQCLPVEGGPAAIRGLLAEPGRR